MNEGMKKGVKQMKWVNEGNITDDHHRVATHNSAVIRMLTAFEVARGCHVTTLCTHSHKSAAPETRKPRGENRGKLSRARNLSRPHEEMTSHRRDARHLNDTVYFVD